jgi:hypothetical protein
LTARTAKPRSARKVQRMEIAQAQAWSALPIIAKTNARSLRQAALTLGFGNPAAERRCATRLQYVKEIQSCGHRLLCITSALLS